MLRAFAVLGVLVFAHPAAAIFCGPGTVLDTTLGGCVLENKKRRVASLGPTVRAVEGNLELRVNEGKDVTVEIGGNKFGLNQFKLDVEGTVALNAAALTERVDSLISSAADDTDTKLGLLQTSIEEDLQPTINTLKTDFETTKTTLKKQVDDLTTTTGEAIATLKQTVADDVQVKLTASEETVKAHKAHRRPN
jgi:hypothetical protein